jgi:signal transduction histidine kinase
LILKLMRITSLFNKALIAVLIVAVFIALLALFIHVSMSRWESDLIEENKALCKVYAEELYQVSKDEIAMLGESGLLTSEDITSSEMKLIDSILRQCSQEQLALHNGLDGGFYLTSHNSFFGYSFPTSPPPVPAYGPPPRSYEIIRLQCLETIETNTTIVELHGFDPALFPLASIPLVSDEQVVGAVWVRIHVEKNMPIVKIRRILNRTTVVAIAGFFVLMFISALFRDEIQGIKKELVNIRGNTGYRLKKRWGIFGYIASTINEMLDTIEKEDLRRQKLEKQLHQKEKMASLGTMVAGVAHEVKTPLSIIKTRLQIWDKEIKAGREVQGLVSHESLQMVVDETDRLTSLVNRLLVFSRPIDKKLKMTDVNLLITEVVNFVSIETGNRGLIIESSLKPDLPLIPLDQSTIRQVLINILGNSCDSMPGGGNIIVRSDLDSEGGCVIISVIDTGSGIPEDVMGSIFDPFFTLKDNGVGLGLAISYQIVKAHKGDIVIRNNPDAGVTCTIQLPLN